jgi:hypothetical protein
MLVSRPKPGELITDLNKRANGTQIGPQEKIGSDAKTQNGSSSRKVEVPELSFSF